MKTIVASARLTVTAGEEGQVRGYYTIFSRKQGGPGTCQFLFKHLGDSFYFGGPIMIVYNHASTEYLGDINTVHLASTLWNHHTIQNSRDNTIPTMSNIYETEQLLAHLRFH
jgi:hypothetical protein